MRFLVACPACRRQFDAGRLEVGSRFHCICGKTLEIPSIQAKDAAVVRCASCGGPRTESATSCRYCGSDFTLYDRDIHTVCSSCMARVSDRARYCHYCACPILPEGNAGSATEHACPACKRRTKLNSRAFGKVTAVSVLECPRCAGLWLAQEAFSAIVERARQAADPDQASGSPAGAAARGSDQDQSRQIRYRHCPVCNQMMNRRNFARRSGIVVDRCKDHGVWFDADELDAVLRWVRTGGLDRAERRDLEDVRAAASLERFKVEPRAPDEPRAPRTRGAASEASILGGGFLADLLTSVFDI